MVEEFAKLFVAAVYGGLVGIERRIRGQYAGFRTQLIVCVGSCLFTIISIKVFEVYGKPADPGRIAAQIITGIGFLGAGAILKHGNYIRGLTTAASLWIVSAIGMAVGFGEYGLGGFATLLVIANLIILKHMENILPKEMYASLTVRTAGSEEPDIKELIGEFKIKLLETKHKYDAKDNHCEVQLSVKYGKQEQLKQLFNKLKKLPNIVEIKIS